MGMVVRTNTMALNAYRQLGMNNSAVAKSLEKLSSGFRINRAGDDAAGLAISEKMKAQIKGLETASSNAQDGISLIQTAEGALTEVHNMLNRMVELATKSANGTYSKIERDAMQNEIDSLLDEINRISESTNFNGLNLLDGSMEAKDPEIKATQVNVTAVADAIVGTKEQKGEFTIDLSQAKFTATGTTADQLKLTPTLGGANFKSGGNNVELSIGAAVGDTKAGSDLATALNGSTIELDGVTYDVTVDADGTTVRLKGQTAPAAAPTKALDFDIGAGTEVDSYQGEGIAVHVVTAPKAGSVSKLAQGEVTLTADIVADGNVLTIGGQSYTFKVGADSTTTAAAGSTLIDLSKVAENDLLAEAANALSRQENSQFIVASDGVNTIRLTEKEGAVDRDVYDLAGTAGNNTDAKWADKDGNSLVSWGKAVEGTGNNGLILQIGDTGEDFNMMEVSIANMSADALGVGGLNIKSAESARAAVDTIKNAINKVSSNRAGMGAMQNRLEYTINNLDVAVENLSAANSRIRDTDMAKEMMNYTKMNVLVQSAQAMLAQANQQPQSVLQLLQ